MSRSFGQHIKTIREKKQVGVRELARRMGRSAAWVVQLEKDRYWQEQLPPFSMLNDLAQVLGVSLQEILYTHPSLENYVPPPPQFDALKGDDAEYWHMLYIRAARWREMMQTPDKHVESLPNGGLQIVPVVNALEVRRIGRPIPYTIELPASLVTAIREPLAFYVFGDFAMRWGLIDDDHALLEAPDNFSMFPPPGRVAAILLQGYPTLREAEQQSDGRLMMRTLDDFPELLWSPEKHRLLGTVVGVHRPIRPFPG